MSILFSTPSCSHPNPVPSSINTPNPPSSLTDTHKTTSSKMNPSKTTMNNPTDPPNHPQLIFNYPLSQCHLYLLLKPSITSLLSHNLLSIPPLPHETTFEFYSGMLMGFAPIILNSYNFFLKISMISSLCKSHTSPLTPLSAYLVTKPSERTIL